MLDITYSIYMEDLVTHEIVWACEGASDDSPEELCAHYHYYERKYGGRLALILMLYNTKGEFCPTIFRVLEDHTLQRWRQVE